MLAALSAVISLANLFGLLTGKIPVSRKGLQLMEAWARHENLVLTLCAPPINVKRIGYILANLVDWSGNTYLMCEFEVRDEKGTSYRGWGRKSKWTGALQIVWDGDSPLGVAYGVANCLE